MQYSQHLAIIVFAAASLCTAQRWEPWPRCWGCVSRASYDSPALGIELANSYATASIRYANGTVRDLTKVDANAEYIAVMRDLDGGGTASIQTVHVLADLLASLRTQVVSIVGVKVPPAMASMRTIKGLHASHVRQALMSASLDPIQDKWTLPASIASALAASHIGLCKDYRSLPKCDVEEARMPHRLALGIHYSMHALSTSLSPFTAAPSAFEFQQDANWTLGKNSMYLPEAADSDYWERLRAAIQRLPRDTHRKVTDVVLMGDAASDERFQSALLDALADILPRASSYAAPSTPLDSFEAVDSHQLPFDPTFAVARGAAELGKRKMEQPDGCVERAYCKWWRGKGGSLVLEL